MIIGTAVLISAKVSVDTGAAPDAVTISIEDPAGSVKETAQAMAFNSATSSWEYRYQSAATDAAGRYVAHIEAASGAYTGVDEVSFYLKSASI